MEWEREDRKSDNEKRPREAITIRSGRTTIGMPYMCSENWWVHQRMLKQQRPIGCVFIDVYGWKLLCVRYKYALTIDKKNNKII